MTCDNRIHTEGAPCENRGHPTHPDQLDGLRAGQVVLFDGHHYQVQRMQLTEKMYVHQDLDGPGVPDSAELDIELRRVLWIEHPDRSPAAPPAPERVVTIPVPDHRSNSVVIDGCAYAVTEMKVEDIRSFGDKDMVRLVLVRLWSNDPDRSAS
jgi:hypothetical protein